MDARNIYGFSAFSSPAVSILAAQIPDTPIAPTTIWDPDNVIITWVAPDNGGSMILNYTIYIRQSDLVTYSTELTHCDGSQ